MPKENPSFHTKPYLPPTPAEMRAADKREDDWARENDPHWQQPENPCNLLESLQMPGHESERKRSLLAFRIMNETDMLFGFVISLLATMECASNGCPKCLDVCAVLHRGLTVDPPTNHTPPE